MFTFLKYVVIEKSHGSKYLLRNCLGRREAHFQVKMYKAPQLRSTFRSCDVEKVEAVVVRSTIASPNVQNTSTSVKKNKGSDYLLTIRLPFDVEKVHAVVAQSTFGSQKCKKHLVLSLPWCVKFLVKLVKLV